MNTKKEKLFKMLPVFIGVFLWFFSPPEGLSSQSWHLFTIFFSTILCIIMKTMPMGAMTIIAITVAICTKTLTTEQALEGFGKKEMWLILFAFFISRGFIKTNLGVRIAYYFIKAFGKNTLGLSYSIIFSEFSIASAIPSQTARNGGIFFPIVHSLSRAFQSYPADKTSSEKLGKFLTMTVFQTSGIISGTFLTAMAGNAMIAKFASDFGVHISWTMWAKAAIVPSIINVIALPIFLYKIFPPTIKSTPKASQIAKEKLKEMGKITSQEIVMSIVFIVMIVLWIFGNVAGIDATCTALIGVSILLVAKILSWKDILEEKGAWESFIWFGALVSMALYLNRFGIISYIGNEITLMMQSVSVISTFLLTLAIYFYSHYFFAGSTTHISAMYFPFLAILIQKGIPPMLASLVLAFMSSIFGGLSHYSSGPAPICFGANYSSLKDWMKCGFLSSIFNIIIWSVVGSLWWKFLGLY